MNVEKRILELIELLAEYLQKTDRLLDRMDKHDVLFEKQFARMDLAYQVIVTHSERIEILQEETKDLQRQTKDLQLQTKELQLQTKEIQQRNDSTFKEILSISKRVQTLEGEQ